MGLITRLLAVAITTAGGIAGSQVPEFTQQYRQRIGGAIDELKTVVADFDRDAEANGLTRREALTRYAASTEDFLRARGISIGGTIERFETLVVQRARFNESHPLMLPVALAQDTDPQILKGTWDDFEPAVPVTPSGALWALIGMVLAWLAAALPWRLGRMLRRDDPLAETVAAHEAAREAARVVSVPGDPDQTR